jgi:hypothetical protein
LLDRGGPKQVECRGTCGAKGANLTEKTLTEADIQRQKIPVI